MSIGTIHPRGTLFFRERVASCQSADGTDLEISLVNMHTPCVECKQTGKFFTLSLHELVDMAIKAGIAENDQEGDV